MPNHKGRTGILSSFTFKILAVMMLIAVVPLAGAFIIFERIAEFNQDLQKEAVESISNVSEIYRAFVKAESARIDIIQKSIASDVDRLLAKHQITRAVELRHSEEFKSDLQKLFDKFIEEYDLITDIRLTLDMTPVVQSGHIPDDSNYKVQAYAVPVAIRSRHSNKVVPQNPVNSDEMPILIAEPVDDEDTESTVHLSGNVDTLPKNLSDVPDVMPASIMGVQLIVLFAIDRVQAERYEKLGENRFLHGTISAIESDEKPGMTDIYGMVFFSVAAAVLLLVIICALMITIPLSRRISLLTRATEKIADGNLDAKVEISGNDQITFLMSQFNAMIDEIQAAQESKAYIERMQAWQEVARRLAHEIKNPLTPIALAIQQLDGKFDDYVDNPPKYRKLLTNVVEIVNEEIETLRKLVKNFSEFARMPVPEKKETCFYQFVVQAVQQNPQFAEQAKKITVLPAPDDIAEKTIEIDNELMRRVIINIVRNGIEAATNAHIDAEIEISIGHAPADDTRHSFCLRIVDNGPGLTDEQKSKLFMPYFTTKSDGTGLGLAIVRKIIEDHNGRVSLHDRDDGNRGTQVDIIL
ncbi:MAG: HAMP domain-containing protein [Proteobacteria bacterium]|nr:HAMP domain-containing protein [Pseudomonadota bacterium]